MTLAETTHPRASWASAEAAAVLFAPPVSGGDDRRACAVALAPAIPDANYQMVTRSGSSQSSSGGSHGEGVVINCRDAGNDLAAAELVRRE
jgi:hypothetical protein